MELWQHLKRIVNRSCGLEMQLGRMCRALATGNSVADKRRKYPVNAAAMIPVQALAL